MQMSLNVPLNHAAKRRARTARAQAAKPQRNMKMSDRITVLSLSNHRDFDPVLIATMIQRSPSDSVWRRYAKRADQALARLPKSVRVKACQQLRAEVDAVAQRHADRGKAQSR
ncbi:MAG: hypothetical protein CTY31_12555 [Hyphomicrobium sp.]|nr:MAG: hypothetical protein CTY39_04450 [Hyphomicrobium sp.]PPC98590.1 MAG: hypothetical protein CTY31_12555 [Hyphomicrobium sp.]